MNLVDIRERIERIGSIVRDDEKAHGAEDGLRADFLRAVAAGSFQGDVCEGARLVLTTDSLDFARWCA